MGRRRRSAQHHRVPAAGLLPGFFLGGLFIAAPFAGTTTAAVAKHSPVKPATHGVVTAHLAPVLPAAPAAPMTAPVRQGMVEPAVGLDAHALTFLVNAVFGVAAFALVMLLLVAVYLKTWAATAAAPSVVYAPPQRVRTVDAVSAVRPVRARSAQSPVPALRVSLRRGWRAVSTRQA